MHPAMPARRRLLSPVAVVLLVLLSLLAVVGAGTSAEARARHHRSSYIVLWPGDHGRRVSALQRYLGVHPSGGHYGPKTRAAVIRWQAAHHRHHTGLVGKLLWSHVRGHAPRPSRSGDRVTGLNWPALARCESGGNPRAVNPHGYYGLYQFSRGTWRSVGGRGLPSHASRHEQTVRAQILYRRAGSRPWPSCGHHLFD
jgi:hypothetical protein